MKAYNIFFDTKNFSDSLTKVFVKTSFALLISLSSISASAFSVWAVDGGADPSENSAGNPLNIEYGVSQSVDLYFDTGGDTSWGWDISLLSNNSDPIFNVSGGDINGGLGTVLVDGYRQLGGNPAQDVIGGPFLLFSFETLLSDQNSQISAIGTYTSGTSFLSEDILAGEVVSAVPLPGAFLYMISGISCIFSLRLSKRN